MGTKPGRRVERNSGERLIKIKCTIIRFAWGKSNVNSQRQEAFEMSTIIEKYIANRIVRH